MTTMDNLGQDIFANRLEGHTAMMKIYNRFNGIQHNLSDLKDKDNGKRHWAKRLDIAKETKYLGDLMLHILQRNNDCPRLQYSEWYDVYCQTLTNGIYISEIVCKLYQYIVRRFSMDHMDLWTTVDEISSTLKNVLEALYKITNGVLPEHKEHHLDQTTERRKALVKSSIDFNLIVCVEIQHVLFALKTSKYREEEGFKRLFDSAVKQFHYIRIGSGLIQVILSLEPMSDRHMGNESNRFPEEFNRMFETTKRLLFRGRYAIRSLSYKKENAMKMRECSEEIQHLTHMFKRFLCSPSELKSRLKRIENLSSKICTTIELGDKCLPAGQQEIQKGITYTNLKCTDSERSPDDNQENTSDGDGNLTEMSPEDIEEFIDKSSMSTSAIHRVFEMEDFDQLVKICMDSRSGFKMKDVGGQVYDGKTWKSAKEVVIEKDSVSFTVEPGKVFAVYYNLPRCQQEFNKKEMEDGASMPINQANCRLQFPPTNVDGTVNVECVIHLTDKDRIEEYKKGNPKSFGDVAVSDGLQVRLDLNIGIGRVEFQQDSKSSNNAAYFSIETAGSRFSDWKSEKVVPKFKNGKLAVDMKLNIDSTFYIVEVKNAKSNQNTIDGILDRFFTLIGLKANCKLLTLYKVLDEKDFTINLYVICVETKGLNISGQARKYLRSDWIRIKRDDESPNFLFARGDKIHLEFQGNVEPEMEPPDITYIKKKQIVQLRFLPNNESKGDLRMDRNGALLDTKELDWKFLLKNWKDALASRNGNNEQMDGPSSSCNLL